MTKSVEKLDFGSPIDLEKTTEHDFKHYSMWEYVYHEVLLPGMYDWTVRPCTNSNILPKGKGMMLVTIDAVLNNNIKVIGCCHLSEDKPHLFQPSLCVDHIWYSVGTEEECTDFSNSIGIKIDDLFPIRICSRVRLKGQVSFPSGDLNNKGEIINQT